MSSIKFIYFDAGLTLIKSNHEDLFSRALEDRGIKRRREEIERAYHLANKAAMKRGLFHKSDGGDAFAFYFLTYLGLDLSGVDFRKSVQKYASELKWSAFDFSKEVLEKLKEEGYGVGLLSNWDHSLREIMEGLGLLPLFDEVVISSEVGYEKPDEKIFSIAVGKTGFKSDECLIVGDNYYDDVLGATTVGMKAVLINPGLLGIEDLDYSGPVIKSVKELSNLLKEI